MMTFNLRHDRASTGPTYKTINALLNNVTSWTHGLHLHPLLLLFWFKSSGRKGILRWRYLQIEALL